MNYNNASLQEQQNIFNKYLTPAMADTILNLADGADVNVTPNEKGVETIHFSKNDISCSATRFLSELKSDWLKPEEKNTRQEIKNNAYKIMLGMTANKLENPQLAEQCEKVKEMINNDDFASIVSLACSVGNYDNIRKQSQQIGELKEFVQSIDNLRTLSKNSGLSMMK